MRKVTGFPTMGGNTSGGFKGQTSRRKKVAKKMVSSMPVTNENVDRGAMHRSEKRLNSPTPKPGLDYSKPIPKPIAERKMEVQWEGPGNSAWEARQNKKKRDSYTTSPALPTEKLTPEGTTTPKPNVDFGKRWRLQKEKRKWEQPIPLNPRKKKVASKMLKRF